MIRGALQLVAASNPHQILQMRGAEGKLLDGARQCVEKQDAANSAWNARWKQMVKAKAPATKGKRQKLAPRG